MRAWFYPVITAHNAGQPPIMADILRENADGTADLVLHDAHRTPQEKVPLVQPGRAHPVAGGWAKPFVSSHA